MHYISQGLVSMDDKCCLLKWQPILDSTLAHYNVYMEEKDSGIIELVYEGLTVSEFLSGPLRYDKEYTFYVTSVNVTGNESEKSAPINFKLSQASIPAVASKPVFEEGIYYVSADPLVIGIDHITKNTRLSFRGDGNMDVKYLFGSEDDYVQYERVTGGLLTGRYVRNGVVVIEKSVDVQPILDIDTASMPFVEVAKHGNTWDFHVSNKNSEGVPSRKTLSMFIDESVYPTEVRFNNDTVTNYMLIDVLMHELSVYDSTLSIVKRDFSKPEHITGKSIITSLSPIIKDGGLQVGSDASLYVQLNTEGIKLEQETYISWKFKSLPTISSPGSLMEWKLGANTIAFDDKTLKMNGVVVCDYTAATPDNRFVIVTNPSGNDAKLILDGQTYPCEFYTSTPITLLHMSMNSTNAEYIVEDFVMQSSENYFLDSIPPDVVTHINAKTGNKEIFLDWEENKSTDIAGYNVYLDGRVHNLSIVTENDYQITGLQNSVEYLVTVTAVDKSGNESVSAEAMKLMTLSDPTYEISDLKIDTSEAGVHIQFTPPTYPGVDKIRIYRESLSNLGLQVVGELSYNETEFYDAPKPDAGKYVYIITTVGLSGSETNGIKVYYNIR